MQYKVGDKVVFNHKTDGFLADGVFTVSHTDTNTNRSTQYIRLKGYDDWLTSDRFLKVPLFKVEQVVRFKNIRDDKWYPGIGKMDNLEGKVGIVMEVSEDYYQANKPHQDGCQYKVRDLQNGQLWFVTSASIELVSAIASIGTVNYYSKEDIIAATTTAGIMAQAVDNVKPEFKIGDTVVIRNDLLPKEYIEWGGWTLTNAMTKYIGAVAKITDYYAGHSKYWKLDIDEGKNSWIVNALLPYTPGSDYDLDKQIINQQTKQNYENQLQREKARISRGDKYTGRAVCSRGCKAQITVGHLSYKEVTQ